MASGDRFQANLRPNVQLCSALGNLVEGLSEDESEEHISSLLEDALGQEVPLRAGEVASLAHSSADAPLHGRVAWASRVLPEQARLTKTKLSLGRTAMAAELAG